MGNPKTADGKQTPAITMARPTLVTADLHISPNRRDAYRYTFLEQTLPQLLEEYSVSRIIICGDLTEAKSGHSAELVNRLVDALAALAERAPIYLLKGNHDYLSEDVPFFRYTQHLPRTRWINEPTQLKLRGLGSCLFLPHTRDLADWVDFMDGYDWFFCHQPFGGAVNETGAKLSGDPPPFSASARVVSGDIHGPQRVGPVTYVGAPYLIDAGDDYEPRVLLLEGVKMRSIPVPGPQKRLVVLRGRDEEYPKVAPGDVVKIRIEPPAGNQTPRAEWRAQARRWAEAAGVELYAVEVIAPKAAPSRADRNRHRASDADLVRAYAKKMRKGKSTISAGLQLMEKTS